MTQAQKFSNLNKVYWPELGITKGELLNYYETVSPILLAHIKNRPQSLNRFPNGVRGESFYQKNVEPLNLPSYIDSVTISSEGKEVEYAICNDTEAILYLINLGCIELNPWLSSLPHLDNPDFLAIDLDPLGIEFKWVVETALETKTVLDNLGIDSYPKTSGATGIHIFIPIVPKYTFEQIRNLAEIIANLIHQRTKAFSSIERMPKKREGKVYVDFLQNGKGKTLAAPYSVRPTETATVSTPLDWRELNKDLSPTDFTIRNIPNRLKMKGDLFAATRGPGIEIEEVINQL